MLKTIAIALLSLAASHPAPLCRYTVRDVAFVDLDDAGYRLRITCPESSPLASEAQREALTRLMRDGNVAIEYPAPAPEVSGSAEASALLIAPDERSLALPCDSTAELAAALDSPMRVQILEEITARFCLVLLARCGERESDARAERAVSQALDGISADLARMPKDVGAPPLMLALDAAGRESERVLLWSLGMDPAADRPQAAVLLGRGRRIGAVLRAEELQASALRRILLIAGQDCECGLERSWMRGPRIPLRWDARTRARAAQLLGFDPQSPMVRAEVMGILSRDPALVGSSASLDEILLGYSEIEVPFPEDVGAPPPAGGAVPAPAPVDLDPADPAPVRESGAGARSVLLLVLGAFVALSLLGGLLVLARRRPI